MNLMCCISKNANDNKKSISWTADLDVVFLQVYLQERKRYDPIGTTQIVRNFSEQIGLELSWKIISRRMDYLNRLQASIFQLCTPDPETGIPIMTKEAWALATKKHPELSNPNSKHLVELLLQKTTPRPLTNSVDADPNSTCFDHCLALTSFREQHPAYNSSSNSSGLDAVNGMMLS